MNKVQFQSGLSMAEFLDQYGSEDQCEAALVAARWPTGFLCSQCSCGHSSSFRHGGRLYFQCIRCRHQSSVISGTVFASTKLPLTSWFLAMHLLTQAKNNVSALELKRYLGACYKTAWLVKHKLMEVMRLRENERQLDGRVEIDDAYFGGEYTGGKVGRGSENKVPFLAAVQTTPDGRPQYVCVRPQPFTPEDVGEIAVRSLTSPATVVSVGLWCFGAVQLVSADHQRIITGGGKASVKLPQLHGINIFLSNLNHSPGIHYHEFDFMKYPHRYLVEAQYRFNRRFDLRSILPRLVRTARFTIPTPTEQLRCG
jgi:hypothetical protein